MELKAIKGVGEKTQQLLEKLDIHSVEDLLSYYPRSYDIYEPPVLVRDITRPGTYAIFAEVASDVSVVNKGRLKLIRVLVKDYEGKGLELVFYNMLYLKSQLKRGYRMVFRGRVVHKMGKLSMEQPAMYHYGEYEEKISSMQPIYRLTAGLSNNLLTKSVRFAMELVDLCHEYMPFSIRNRYQLMDYSLAMECIHFPKNKEDYIAARYRLVFDEFFFFILALRQMKQENSVATNDFHIRHHEEVDLLLKHLPYELTGAQKKAYEALMADLTSKKMMNRLIQGDVGSGKTIVAFLALIETALSGYQGAMMVPTEVLAKQQYKNLVELLEANHLPISVGLLIGSTTTKEKKVIYEQLKKGEISLVIGTSALIQEKVEYENLALVITDEQHRFGVNQRKLLSDKGTLPNICVMSATPIPRTLAVIFYGDLDLTVMDELPKTRLPIKNCVVDSSFRPNAYRFMRKQVEEGRQVYIICPMVEESDVESSQELENVEEYSKKMQEVFPEYTIGMLHGKMKAKEKNAVMEAFALGKISILVSTTVIEVGVDVPNATVMMIENAERFGLAQLHQLRGRVGRGAHQSYCIFMSDSKDEHTKSRLEVMNSSNDGFYIASEDLKTRGPGDLFGLRQSGDFDFGLGDIYQDATELALVSQCVEAYEAEELSVTEAERQVIGQKVDLYTRKCLNKLNI
ncbi:MAG: ATP-dependent DNA helicase RecG [Lachnospiraceae bacterium]|nr:ATP-dependent DNA helicase RecG [Lachnospiraceae bacterium]